MCCSMNAPYLINGIPLRHAAPICGPGAAEECAPSGVTRVNRPLKLLAGDSSAGASAQRCASTNLQRQTIGLAGGGRRLSSGRP